MNRIEQQIIKDREIIKQLDVQCRLSKNLYNYVNYCIRQSFIKTGKIPNEYELVGKLTKRDQHDFRSLPSNVSQQVIKLLYKNWKSFFAASKDYSKHPTKYTGRPKLPKYKDVNGKNCLIFTTITARVKGDGKVHFVKNIIKPITTKISKEKFVSCRIIPHATCYKLEVIYKQEKNLHENINIDNKISIDLGVNNLITTFNNIGEQPFIINGKPLKSINQYYNKKKAELMSYVGDRGISNKILNITHKRNNKVKDYLHKTSRNLINYCLSNNIGTIIIGQNKQWKQNVNIGKRNNQTFTNIPHVTLINQIKYKAEQEGIDVLVHEESYTSKIDHLAKEIMCHHDTYLGRRIMRGLFKSSTGKYVNADVNGAIGIMRKVISESEFNQIIDSGFMLNPFKINLF